MKILHPLGASLLSTISILARRVAFPLLFLGAGLVLVQPCAGQTWTATGSLTTARNAHTATLLPNGSVLAASGDGPSGSGRLTSAELYDPVSGTWTATGSLATGRVEYTATLLPNGNVLIAGGLDINFNPIASAELYDPASGAWSATSSLATARYIHTATLLPNGKVLVAGGTDGGYPVSAELYDPVGGTWTATGSLASGRKAHTATLLPNGKVLVAGGFANGALWSAELYDPASGTWIATGHLFTQRHIHTATLLPNGKVLVAGGLDANFDPLASAELYDPASGTWTATGSLASGTNGHTATLLPNGEVLLAAGRASNFNDLARAELYDPASETWTATGSLGTTREFHTATLLPINGKVLVAGGYNANGISGALASAELYDPATIPNPTPTPTPTPTSTPPTPTPTPTPTPPTPTPTPTPTPPPPTPTPTSTPPTPTPRPATLANISTRLSVGTSDQVMIAGFIVQGSVPKRVLIRAAGPSLTQFGVPNALANPRLELHDSTSTIGMNDNWQTTQISGVITSDQVAEIQNSGLEPSDPLESTLIATLAPGSYTAIVQGVNGGTGVGIVEVYDLNASNGSLLANISTRGFVQSGDNAMIGGFIVVTQSTRVIIRAIGPSLTPFGVPDALANPQLELHDANSLIGRNGDWQATQLGGIITSDQVTEIQNSQLAPTNPAESAIIATLPPGSYSAIVRGANNTTGNALVEAYALP
jgi:hypothetical protein